MHTVFNSDWEVETPEGWKNFKGINRIEDKSTLLVSLDDGSHIRSTPDHIFFIDDQPVRCDELIIGSCIDGNTSLVIDIQDGGKADVFDLVESEDSRHRFTLSNGKITKNCDELAFAPQNMVEDMFTSLSPTLACVAGDTLVLSRHGFKKIEDYHRDREVGDYFKLSGDIFAKNGFERLSHGYVSPKSNTLIVETSRGRLLEVTPDHPLYALHNSVIPKMIKSSDLAVGDLVRVEHAMNVFNNDPVALTSPLISYLTPELAYCIGGWLAEGWISKNRNVLYVSNGDQEFRDRYVNNTFRSKFKLRNNVKLYTCSRTVVELFEEVGCKQEWKSHTKEIPSLIWDSGRSVQVEFLKGLFDGDGSVSDYRVVLSSTSRKLLNQTQLMLSNFGIVSDVSLALSEGMKMLTAKDAFTLSIPPGHMQLFQEQVGFGISRKQVRLNLAVSRIKLAAKVDAIPTSQSLIDFVRECVSATGLNHRKLRYEHNLRLEKALWLSPKSVMTTDFLTRLRDVMKQLCCLSQEHANIFEELLGSFFWEKIKSITPSINRTFDFTVPKSHSFIQNGILGSNTGGSAIITSTPKSDVDMFAQIWFGANKLTDEYGNPTGSDVGINGYHALSAIWSDHPDRDQKWADEELSSIGEQKFRQEHLCHFVSDDSTLVSALCLARQTPVKPAFYTGTVRWFCEPIPNRVYAIALDPCMGTGGDNAAIQVFVLPELIQVAEWQHDKTDCRGQVRTLWQLLVDLRGELLDNPEQIGEPEIYWTFENNSIGEAVRQIIEDTGEERFPGTLINEKKRRGAVRRAKKGLCTTTQSKRFACARMKSLIESDRMIVNSREALNELKTFVARGASYAAKSGSHDDLVSAILLITRMIEGIISQSEDMIELKEIIDTDEESNTGAMPMTF